MRTPDSPDTVTMGYKDLMSSQIDPSLNGPPKPGRIYFTGKIFTNLTLGQKIRTGSNNPDSRRKNQKSRPWLVLDVRKDGNISVISLTTRNNKLWEGLSENDVNSFLPLGTTPTIPGREKVELLSNTCGIFKGTSLIFLEIERVVPASSLGHPVGEITPGSLELVRAERDICARYWRQQRGRQVYSGQWKQPCTPRSPNPMNNGRTRAASLSNKHFGGDQFLRSQGGKGRTERSQAEKYHNIQFQTGETNDQISSAGRERRWSIQ